MLVELVVLGGVVEVFELLVLAEVVVLGDVVEVVVFFDVVVLVDDDANKSV